MAIASRDRVLEEDVSLESSRLQNRILLLILCLVATLICPMSFSWKVLKFFPQGTRPWLLQDVALLALAALFVLLADEVDGGHL